MALRLRIPLSLVAALAAAALLVGCDDLTFTDDDAPLQTDQRAYELRQNDYGGLQVEIPYTYRNTTGRPVYLTNCSGSVPLVLQKYDAGEWTTAWSPIMTLCLSEPIVVGNGATRQDTVHFFAAPPGDDGQSQSRDTDPVGIYRIVWSAAYRAYDPADRSPGPLLSLRARVSNGFELRAP